MIGLRYGNVDNPDQRIAQDIGTDERRLRARPCLLGHFEV